MTESTTTRRRRRVLSLAVAAGTLTLAGVAAAWKIGAPTDFKLPPQQTAKPWPGPAPKHVAVKVRTDTGKVTVAATPAGSGAVPAKTSAIWEGTFTDFTLTGAKPGMDSEGHYAVNEASDTDLDALVGEGVITLPVPGVSGFTIYAFHGSTPAQQTCRSATVRAGADQVTLKAKSGSYVHPLSIDAGDTAICVRTVKSFTLDKTGTTPDPIDTSYWIEDPSLASLAREGTASRQVGDLGDAFSLDGTAHLKITIRNTSSSGQIQVGCSHGPNPVTLEPGQEQVFPGPISTFAWTYQGGAESVWFKVEKMP